MRIIFFLFILFSIAEPVLCQEKPLSKTEMQAQMLEAVNALNIQIAELEKQIAEAKINKEDAETIKQMEDQVATLKKQVAMMGGLNKKISGISEKTFQQSGEKQGIVPGKDSIRINLIPIKILTDAGLVVFIRNVHTQVEKMIPAAEREVALKIYNETKAENKSATAIGGAASGCWMYGHQEKAVWLMGKVCIDNPGYSDNLNNYAAFLSMMGGEQAAIPILLYLNNKFPKNPSLLNNIGQAWFGLGDLELAKKYLDSATELYPTHSMANGTLSKIYLSKRDSAKAIEYLKNSISESYSTEKESSLTLMGTTLTTDDLPEFTYPVEQDPFGFDRFFNIIPAYQSGLGDYEDAVGRWQAFQKALAEEIERATTEEQNELKKFEKFKDQLLADSAFREKMLFSFASPAHILASRYLTLTHEEEATTLFNVPLALSPFMKTAFPVSMLLTIEFFPFAKPAKRKPISYDRAFREFTRMLQVQVYEPLILLEEERKEKIKTAKGCGAVDGINAEFVQKVKNRAAVADDQIKYIYNKYQNELDLYIALYYYGANNVEKFARFSEDVAGNNLPENKFTTSHLYKKLLVSYGTIINGPKGFKSSCSGKTQEIPETQTILPSPKTPGCAYEKTLAIINGMAIKVKCGRIIMDETKLKNNKNGETKGSAITSKEQSPAYNPMGFPMGRWGPSFSHSELNDPENFIIEEQPLFTGQEDSAAFYIEYDKYGNLTDFKMKLNKNGNGLAGSDPKRDGLNSRWTWIATSSGREQKLVGLFKK